MEDYDGLSVTFASMISYQDRDIAEDEQSYSSGNSSDYEVKLAGGSRAISKKLRTFVDLNWSGNGCRSCFNVYYIGKAELVQCKKLPFQKDFFLRCEKNYNRIHGEFIQCLVKHPNIERYCSIDYYGYLSHMHEVLSCEGVIITRGAAARLFRLYDRLITVWEHCHKKTLDQNSQPIRQRRKSIC